MMTARRWSAAAAGAADELGQRGQVLAEGDLVAGEVIGDADLVGAQLFDQRGLAVVRSTGRSRRRQLLQPLLLRGELAGHLLVTTVELVAHLDQLVAEL